MRYNPGSFLDVFISKNGENIWDFITRKEVTEKLILTSNLGFPAIEGIGESIYQQFSLDPNDDRCKQMIGHMIKQIMLNLGYYPEVANVKCTKQSIFKNGTRYTRFPFSVSYKGYTIEAVPNMGEDGLWRVNYNIVEYSGDQITVQNFFKKEPFQTAVEAASRAFQYARENIDSK